MNGELRQDDTTDRLTWGFAWLINYISTFATLKPGDLIWTGTPTGAGGHQKPPAWLKPGDVVEVEVPEIGVLRNTVVDEVRCQRPSLPRCSACCPPPSYGEGGEVDGRGTAAPPRPLRTGGTLWHRPSTCGERADASPIPPRLGMLTHPESCEVPGVQRPMAKLQLSFACGLYDRMQPLYTGEVKADGIDLNFIAIDQPRPIFDRMSGGEEFDVAEYSSSEFVQRFANKQCPFVAIPVFPSRAFRHGFIAHPQQGRHQQARRTSKASAWACRSTP